jgi:hypothetical protein
MFKPKLFCVDGHITADSEKPGCELFAFFTVV